MPPHGGIFFYLRALSYFMAIFVEKWRYSLLNKKTGFI